MACESRIFFLLGQKSCRTKVSRIFGIFAPNFAPNFSRSFRGLFVLRFVGDEDQKKNHQKSPPFFNAKFPGKQEKYSQNSSGEQAKYYSQRIDSRFFKTSFFANRTSKNWDSSEDWTRITRISIRIGEKTRFARIWPSASKLGILLRIDSRESAKRWCVNRQPNKPL